MRRYRSFFWPAVLILIGVFALLVNAGVLSSDRLGLLADLWPVILIVVGLEILSRRALPGQAGDVAAVLIVLLAAGGAIAYVALAPNPGTTHTLDSSAAIGSLDHASVEIDAGSANVTIGGAKAVVNSSDLYQAHITYSGPKPEVTFDRSSGRLQISQSSSGFAFQSRRFTVDLEVNANVQWKITTSEGASTDTFNLGGVPVGSIDINTGASREDITLGMPSGVVPITINGGALTVHIHRPPGSGASAAVSGGAVSLDFDGRSHHAIGNVQDSAGSGTDTYRIEVDGGACTVTVDPNGPTA